MPVHQFMSDGFLVGRGLTNYWGYNTIGFLAPHNAYSSSGQLGEQVPEFKEMVRRLHEAGIEVILDVVYNHTAEGNHLGPTLSYRGIDNAAYYRLSEKDQQYYQDTTGTGNSLNVRHPHALQLIMDSLRYWVLDMHVDGFRFDLAASLARQFHEVDRLSAFFDLVQQDPVVSQVKPIAEPWDVGAGGYQVGNFPPLWTEWNGKYRDAVRDFWRGQPATLPEFASRLTGSADLVSYNHKHNQANGEDNRDGSDDNRSWNCGAEGPTDDAAVLALRARQQRNFLATLLLSQGVPMLLAGDEFGRSQQGNNNAYCQDNELSWLHWPFSVPQPGVAAEFIAAAGALADFTRELIQLRAAHPVFRRRRFFAGPTGQGGGESLTVFLNGGAISEPGSRGEPIVDDSFLLMFNAAEHGVEFTIPSADYGEEWVQVIDTADPRPAAEFPAVKPGDAIVLTDRSVRVLRRA